MPYTQYDFTTSVRHISHTSCLMMFDTKKGAREVGRSRKTARVRHVCNGSTLEAESRRLHAQD